MIRRILEGAMELPPADRSAYLDSECAADPDLRKDVDLFLSLEGKLEPGFLESPAAEQVRLASTTAVSEMILTAGLARDLEKRFPVDTLVQSIWLPTIQAQLALNRNDPGAAITALQAAYPVEFSRSEPDLYHVYIRGTAYMAAGEGSAAAAEFQKIIDHSGLVTNSVTGALAHLGVARANALRAKTSQGTDADAARVRARAAYKDFLTLWKDADPDIPILKQAKAEYAKL
jgi:hypothetical protein